MLAHGLLVALLAIGQVPDGSTPLPPTAVLIAAAPSDGCKAPAGGADGDNAPADRCDKSKDKAKDNSKASDAKCESCPLFPPGTLLNPQCCLGDPWKLFDNPCLKSNNTTIAGWLAQSYTLNTSSPADRFNGPVAWTDRSNEWQLNQLYFYAEKTTKTDGCGCDFGYRADVLFGTDYRFNTASGLETRGYFTSPKISTQRFYGTSFPQFYGEAAIDDWKVKVGHFFAPVGYEFVPASENFFTTKAWCPQNEPYTMTGAIATYTASKDVSLGAGIVHGWDNFDNSNPFWSFLGSIVLKFSNDATLSIQNVIGDELNQNNGFSFRYLQTNVYTLPLKNISDRLTYVGQVDYAYQADALVSGHAARWYDLNQYLFYKMSDCLTYGARLEWFRDEEGFRMGGYLGTIPDGATRGLSDDRSGYIGSFYEITLGARYKYTANTTVRPFVRFDWFSGVSTDPHHTGLPEKPFNNGYGNSQTLLGFDTVTLF